jgi:hypothetical protein
MGTLFERYHSNASLDTATMRFDMNVVQWQHWCRRFCYESEFTRQATKMVLFYRFTYKAVSKEERRHHQRLPQWGLDWGSNGMTVWYHG